MIGTCRWTGQNTGMLCVEPITKPWIFDRHDMIDAAGDAVSRLAVDIAAQGQLSRVSA